MVIMKQEFESTAPEDAAHPQSRAINALSSQTKPYSTFPFPKLVACTTSKTSRLSNGFRIQNQLLYLAKSKQKVINLKYIYCQTIIKGDNMEKYLEEFRSQLKKHEGSLVKVSAIKSLNRHAKEYLNRLSKLKKLERVEWGWYYITPKVQPKNALEFLAKDRNFKIIVGTTAASFWNLDFIHRDSVDMAVDNHSYKKAVESFAIKRGWRVNAEYSRHADKIRRKKFGNLAVEDREETIVDCVKQWAFMDALALLSANRKELAKGDLMKESHWSRVSGSNVRVKQVIEYAAAKLGLKKFAGRADIKEDFIKRVLDEAVEKVVEFG